MMRGLVLVVKLDDSVRSTRLRLVLSTRFRVLCQVVSVAAAAGLTALLHEHGACLRV
jgi:hypothetical protein